MSAKPHRGEVTVKLGEREVVLRPTFAALVAIERETGMGLATVFTRMSEGSIEHVPIVIREAARAGGEEIERAAIEDHMTSTGIASALNGALALLVRAISGGGEKTLEPSQAAGMATD